MEAYGENRVIFIHIPKTGGMTFHKILENQYRKDEFFLLHPFTEKYDDFMKLVNTHPNRIKCLAGHIPYGYHSLFSGKCAYVTMLRNPIERVISQYYYACYLLKHTNTEGKWYHNYKINLNSFMEYIDSEYFAANIQTMFISGKRLTCKNKDNFERADTEDLTYDDLEMAKNNLRENIIFGLTEKFDESLMLMKNELNWGNIMYQKVNITPNKPLVDDLDIEIINAIKEKNKYDIELYDYACSEFERKIKKLGNKFTEEVDEFRFYYSLTSAISNLKSYNKIFNVKVINYFVENIKYKKENKEKKVVIFGGSSGGERIINFIKEINERFKSNINIVAIVDNDKSKTNTKIAGIKIISPYKGIIRNVDKIIVASIAFYDIEAQLVSIGIEVDKIIQAFNI